MDNTSLALAGATVTVVQVTTGYTQSVKTGATGDYLFPSLPVGSYQLTVTMTGFTTYVQNGITLTVGQAATQNVSMRVGSVSQQITVQANASLVTTDDPQIGQLINQKSMASLPMNGRNFTQMIKFTPMVNISSSVNGSRTAGINYQVDGTDNNDPWSNAVASNQGGRASGPGTTTRTRRGGTPGSGSGPAPRASRSRRSSPAARR